uniref:PDZ and LIM domain 7 n=1 Tax=Sus scrofa TaxID=9823 RepID=A0A8D2A8Q6_PIG
MSSDPVWALPAWVSVGGYPAKRALPSEGAPRAAPESVPCPTSQPCASGQPAGPQLGKAALPIPTPGTWSPTWQCMHPGISHGASRTKVGWEGPCQESQQGRALNGRSCSQVPRTEAPAPASATPQEPWPGEREWAWLWAWARVGNLQGDGGGLLQVGPGYPPRPVVGSLGTPPGATFLALAGPPTPSPTSRPPWAVDPAFAERYAPDKTSTVLTRHTQPATPTPMQNRTSIVQAAAGGGPGGGSGSNGKTPVCHQCHKVIRGRYLVALGHAYHPEEFVCSQCGKVLEEGGFFEEKGSIFCPPCYDVRYAPSCAKCKKKITGEIMHALKMTWHVHCFTCAACKTPIRNRAFYMEEGVPYCERDYEKMFGTKCRGCDFKIDAGDRFLEALGFSWHDTCFVCAICQINLEGKTFYSKKDKPLCKSHAFSHV